MRKILIILGLFLTLVISGQPIGIMASQGAVSGYCDEYQAVLDEMTTDPTGDTLTWQNNMVVSLNDGGYWTGLHALYIFATTDNGAGEALINWKNPGTYTASEVSDIAWTKRQGYTGNNSTDEIQTFNPSGVVAQDNTSVGIYIRTPNVQDAHSAVRALATDQINLTIRNTSNEYQGRINSTAQFGIAGVTDATGLFILSRRGATDIEGYRNGVSLDTETDVSTAVPNITIQLLYLVPYQAAIFFVTVGLSDDNVTAINTIFETYMDAIGSGVQ